jgi:hypothetical protein
LSAQRAARGPGTAAKAERPLRHGLAIIYFVSGRVAFPGLGIMDRLGRADDDFAAMIELLENAAGTKL